MQRENLTLPTAPPEFGVEKRRSIRGGTASFSPFSFYLFASLPHHVFQRHQ
jgi:hypothetical protein